LYITVTIAPHPYFRREKNDVYLDVPITLEEALDGAKIKVPTIKASVMVTIPPHTHEKTKLRLKGQGIETEDGAKGDEYLTVYITLPNHITKRGKELLADFFREHNYNPREQFERY
jgi:DnaJ-class molecular chaperone